MRELLAFEEFFIVVGMIFIANKPSSTECQPVLKSKGSEEDEGRRRRRKQKKKKKEEE